METPIPENVWPARRLILMAMLFGYVLVAGVMAYMYWMGAVGRLAPRFLISAAGMASGFALLYVAITLVIRRSGNWKVSDEGLHFISASAKTDSKIPWQAISRMKITPVSLVIWWTEEGDMPTDAPLPRRSVLFVDPDQGRDLLAACNTLGGE